MATTKLTADLNIHQSKPDTVRGQSTATKVYFDSPPNSIKTYINDVLTVEIDTLNSENAKLTGNQTIAGVKTFSSSPIVPTPTTDMQTATKKYIDDIETELKEDISSLTTSILGGWYTSDAEAFFEDNTPESMTAIYRYTVMGRICYFVLYFGSPDGNAATFFQATLPVLPGITGRITAINGIQIVGNNYYNLVAYIGTDGETIFVKNFQPWTDGAAGSVSLSGFYELAEPLEE